MRQAVKSGLPFGNPDFYLGVMMRNVSKVLSVILLGSILLTACGTVKPIAPSVTPTVFVSPTAQLIKTAAPPDLLATSIPIPTATTEPVDTDYQLRPWIANDDFYAKLLEENPKEYYHGIHNDSYRYDLVFQAESLLRDHSDNWQDVAWQIVADYPQGIPLPEMRPNEDLLAFLIEDLLNNQGVEPNTLLTILQDKNLVLPDCYYTEIADSALKQGDYLIVNNLFGDHQDARLFYVGPCHTAALYALHKVNNYYRVEKIREWQDLEITAASFQLSLDTVGDINNNYIPEIVVDVALGASGTPPSHRESIELYEWDPSKQAFVTDTVDVMENICDFSISCDDNWTLGAKNAQGKRPMIVHERYATMSAGFDVENPLSCDNVVVEHTYLWDQGRLVELKQELLPSTDKRMECQLSWALQVLDRRVEDWDRATTIISKALLNWPNEMNDMWGPASKDYFAFRLGLAYDMLGQDASALTLIQNIAEHPSNPGYKYLSELASSYLSMRSNQGKVKACNEISLLETESLQKNNLFETLYTPVDELRKIWGYGAQIWMYRMDDICDGKLALKLFVRQQQSSQPNDLDNVLKISGLTVLNEHTIYDSGNLKISVATLLAQNWKMARSGVFERSDYVEAWLFTQSSTDFTAAYLDDINQNTNIAADHIELKPNEVLVTIQTDFNFFQRYFIYHIAPSGEVQNQLDDYYVEGYINHITNEIETIAGSSYDNGADIAVYKWNDKLATMDKRIANFDFSSAQYKAEWLIFHDRDFLQAARFINEFFTQAPPEPRVEDGCGSSKCDYYPEWYRPYMRYLLALSYEMAGQTYEAHEVYFDLWRDYPTDIFGLVAEHRLVAVKP